MSGDATALSGIRLRAATAADVDAIDALEQVTFPEDAWSRSMIAAEVADPNGWYLVAESADAATDRADGEEDDTAVLGYAGLRAPRGLPQADVQTLAVAEAARGRGLGRTLLRELIGEAERRGSEELFLEVRADNSVAQQLYVSEGFEQIAVRPRYYNGRDDALIMRRELSAAATATPAQTPVASAGPIGSEVLS